MYVPTGFQIISMLELLGELQKVWMPVPMPHAQQCHLIYLERGLGFAFLIDPQVILCTDKFGNRWY